MLEFIKETYFVLLPIVATGLVGWVGYLLKEQHRREDEREKKEAEKENEALDIQKAQSEGIMMILRYMLQRYHSEFKIQGKITWNQYKNWTDFYSVYEALHGNSIAKEWNEEVEAMEKDDSDSDISLYALALKESAKK